MLKVVHLLLSNTGSQQWQVTNSNLLLHVAAQATQQCG
jgi:hypothetical protein